MEIDSLNWKILKCLQLNARQSHTEIGRQVGISSPAVSERIKKLEDAGIIERYNALVSPFEVGYQLKALITLRAFMGMLKPFLEKVKTYDEVINCYRITGNENIVMEVVLKNQKHLIQKRIYSILFLKNLLRIKQPFYLKILYNCLRQEVILIMILFFCLHKEVLCSDCKLMNTMRWP